KKGDTPADTKLFNKLLAISSPKLAVASAKNAAHAKNADKLGGLAPSAFQLRVSHSCTASNAIQAIASDGTVSCQPTGNGTVTGQFVTNVSTGAVLTCGPSGSNAALGSGALSSNTLGSNNSAVGLNALSSDTNDLGNTAVGDYALSSNTSGGGNTAVGHQALSSHTTGGGNTALGLNALYNGSAGVT